MFQQRSVSPFNESRQKTHIPPCPTYGGVLDSPLVFPNISFAGPITPRSATQPLSILPDTSSNFQESSHVPTGIYSPVTPPWPATPSSTDVEMHIAVPEPEHYALHIPQRVYEYLAPAFELEAPFRSGFLPSPPMDVDPEPCEEVETLVDEDEPYDYTASPFYSPPPELDEDDGFSPTSPLSPALELDEIDLAPCSPSLRLNTSLPDFTNDWKCSLFSLPGAVVDEDLISSDLSLPKTIQDDVYELPTPSSTATSLGSSSLLMINSTCSIPTPSTPPQDQLDIDVRRLDEHPDLRRLAVLRKKSQEMEKALKVVEEQMLQQGEVQARADVRRERKWYKERSREITAMLKLVVGDDIFSRPADSTLPAVPMGKKTIATMDHLVARMVFKRRERNDLPRPIASGTRGPAEKTRHASRLCQSVTAEQ